MKNVAVLMEAGHLHSFSFLPLGIWHLKSPHPRVFAIQGKKNKNEMPGGQQGGGGGGASRSWNWLMHYVRQDWILSQKFGSKLFCQFWQKKIKWTVRNV